MRWSVRHILLTYSVTILLVTALMIGCVAYITGRYSVEYLAQQSMRRQSQQLKEYTQSLLDKAARPGQLLTARLTPPPRREELESHFPELRQLANVYPELSYLSIALEESGDYIHIHRFSDRHLEEARYQYQAAGKSLRTDFRWESGKRVPLTRRTADYDARQRPYYLLAKQSLKPVWTPAYPFRTPSGPPELGVTRSSPLLTGSGRLAGVVSTDFTLASLTRYLKHLPLSANSRLCLVEESAPGQLRILAHTNPALTGQPITEDAALAQAITAIPVEQLQQELHLTTLQHGGERFLVSGALLDRPTDPHWRIYGLTPKADLMAPVYQSLWLGVGVALLGVVGAVWLSVRIARQIALPLHALARQAESLGEQAFDPYEVQIKEPSSVKEISHLQEAIARTHKRLQERHSSPSPSNTVAVLVFDAQSIGLYRSQIAASMERFTALIQREGTVVQRGSFDLVALWTGENQIESAYRTLQECQAQTQQGPGTDTPPLLISVDHDALGEEPPLERARLLRRLTPLNTVYGTSLLATQALVRHPHAQELLLTRPVEKIRLESEDPIVIAELLGFRKEADETLLRLSELGSEFMERYLARDFNGAEQCARASLRLRPNDPLMRRHLASAIDCQRLPPPAAWDASRTL